VSPDPVSWLVVEPGWRVLAADGSEVGRVEEVLGDTQADIFSGLAVSTRLLAKPRYVPSEHVGEIRQGVVTLTLQPNGIERLEAHEPPAGEERHTI
jgi:hypothetical protein